MRFMLHHPGQLIYFVEDLPAAASTAASAALTSMQHGQVLRLRAAACMRAYAPVTYPTRMQAAAEEVAREHPDGIDFLIVNAGVIDPQHKSAIDT